jgi:Bacterial Peptidase A24 N-terminal domain
MFSSLGLYHKKMLFAFSFLVGAALGACVGSFLSCAAWRIPQRVSLSGRSICPSCGVQLKERWNLPIVGWLALRGRSGCCRQPISPRYIGLEALAALVGGLLAAVVGLVPTFAVAVATILVVGGYGQWRAEFPPPVPTDAHEETEPTELDGSDETSLALGAVEDIAAEFILKVDHEPALRGQVFVSIERG